MIINCSMRHSPSGRKRKTNAYKKAKRPEWKAHVVETSKALLVQKLDTIPSVKPTKYVPDVDNSWKLEESKNFTVAPAYNKGAYQVIPRGDVEWIGK